MESPSLKGHEGCQRAAYYNQLLIEARLLEAPQQQEFQVRPLVPFARLAQHLSLPRGLWSG